MSQRTIEERVGVRSPGLARGAMRAVLRLPTGSRVRKAMLRRFARIAFLSWNRGDFELVPYRAMADWNDAWRDWDAEIEEVIDEGPDRVLIVAQIYGEGQASGIKLEEWGAVRYTFREGLILLVEGAFDSSRERALEALAASSNVSAARLATSGQA
jgi:hypothetical protein